MERSDAAHDAPRFGRGLSAHGSALLCLSDPRAELATMLILQELGLSVDLAADVESAIRWVRQARYQLLVVGGTRAPLDAPLGVPLGVIALCLRHAAPDARIVVLADEWEPPDGLAPLDIALLGIEVLRPPLDVNALMRGLWPAA